jgi:histidine triad (HIT) family protein
MSCIFCKIAKHETNSSIVYEDEHIMCFRDTAPQAPVHCLLIPKKHVADLFEIKGKDWQIIGHLMAKVPEMARLLGIEEEGFRLVNNCKAQAGQSVFHLHFHLMGGRHFSWPPG